MISSECPHCNKAYQIEDIHIWREAECPNCKKKFIIRVMEPKSEIIKHNWWTKKLIVIIASLALILTLLITYEKVNTWKIENKRKETLSNPVDLGKCKPFTDKLKSCESFTCEYDSINWMINGSIHTKFNISWKIDNCKLTQTNTIDWDPYYGYECNNLSQQEWTDLSNYYNSMLNSNWTNFSYEMSMWWESILKINWEEIKDVLNQLINSGKCTIEIKNNYN